MLSNILNYRCHLPIVFCPYMWWLILRLDGETENPLLENGEFLGNRAEYEADFVLTTGTRKEGLKTKPVTDSYFYRPCRSTKVRAYLEHFKISKVKYNSINNSIAMACKIALGVGKKTSNLKY